MLGHRHEVPAHQPPGGLFGIGERARHRLAGFRLQLGHHRALIGLVQILDQLHRIVGVELFGDDGDGLRGQRVHQIFADVIVEFGDDVAGHQIADRGGELRALARFEQLDQVGDVGGMERLDQIVNRALVAGCQRNVNRADKRRLQPVFPVVPLVIDAVVRAHLGGNRLWCRIGDHQIVCGDAVVGHAKAFTEGMMKSKAGG